MKKRIAVLTLLLALAVPGGILRAERFTDKVGGVSLWLPDDWETDSDQEDGYMSADAPENDSFCILRMLDVDNLAGALDVYGDALAEEIEDFVSISEDQKGEIDGMASVAISGEGRRDDTAWSVRVTLVSTGESVALLVIGWEKAKDSTFAPLAGKIVNSIKKLK
ncbi:MAG TPA: hypothetical protein VF451_08105 [Acidobacteriota bacterium]